MGQQLFFFSDLDGTLEDSRRDMTDAVHAVRAALGLPARDDAAVMPNVNRGIAELYAACFDDWLAQWPGPRQEALAMLTRLYETEYAGRIAATTRLYDGIAEALQALAAVGKVIVVTNKPEALSRLLLQALGVADCVTDVMGGDTLKEGKPSPLPLHVAGARHGFVPGRDRAFMIGDTAADVRCGKAFGATTVWCAWGYLPAPPEPAPDRVADHPRALLQLLAD